MGIFDNNYEKSSDKTYEDIKKYLKSKDGKKHIILINSMMKMTTNGWECENKYTIQIDTILEHMQDDGYEILDLKIEHMENSLLRTLIIYK